MVKPPSNGSSRYSTPPRRKRRELIGGKTNALQRKIKASRGLLRLLNFLMNFFLSPPPIGDKKFAAIRRNETRKPTKRREENLKDFRDKREKNEEL
jgi:hypothetical protein